MAVQWRKSPETGFSSQCCPNATLVPGGSSGKAGNSRISLAMPVKLSPSDLLNLGLRRCIALVPATTGRSGKDLLVKLKCLLIEFAADQSGATAIEYGLIAAGIALAIIEVIYALGTNLVARLQSLATALK